MSHHFPVDLQARGRKRKALLAGGVVLGLGATMTLAAWTDDVWVNGAFSAGKFNVQGNTGVGGWQDYDSAPGGGLVFSTAPTAMTPNDAVYAPLNLRVDPIANSYDAAITLRTAPTGPAVSTNANNALFTNLTVTLYTVAPGSCSEAGTSGVTPIVNQQPLPTTVTASPIFTLLKNSTEQGVCFKFQLKSDAPATVRGGTTGVLEWRFHAESV